MRNLYIDQFCDYLKLERNYSDRTIQSYRMDLELFKSFMGGLDSQLDFLNADRDVVRQHDGKGLPAVYGEPQAEFIAFVLPLSQNPWHNIRFAGCRGSWTQRQ